MPGGWEWLILVGVVLLLFGAKRLPEMARSVGQSARVFRGEMKGMKSDDEARKATDQPAQPPAAQPAPPTALPPVQAPQASAQQAKQEPAAEPTRVSQPGSSTTGQ